MAPKTKTANPAAALLRVRLWHSLLIIILAVFGLRLFYLQVIKYDHFKNAALDDQLKQYQIPANRGTISVHNGDSVVPIVLNQKLYTLFADPTFVKAEDTDKYTAAITRLIGGQASDYTAKIHKKGTHYVVLAKKLSADQSKQVAALKLPGLGTEEQQYRIYPQGQLASQLLGFVNNDNEGNYGIEQALNGELAGKPGQLKAITDVHGVPLAASCNF